MSASERKLWVVTATTDPNRTRQWCSWGKRRATDFDMTIVWNGVAGVTTAPYFGGEFDKDQSLLMVSDYLGVVPAFCLGLHAVIHRAQPQDIIALLHDDVEIFEQDWDLKVLEHFDSHPATCLAGFFGATGLGAPDIYKTPYDPMQLARMDCWSNMDDAEAHGQRSTEAKRVVVLDGFSQIMSVPFAEYALRELEALRITHHFYDGALGCLAARQASYGFLDKEVWMIPIRCHHAGGQTARVYRS